MLSYLGKLCSAKSEDRCILVKRLIEIGVSPEKYSFRANGFSHDEYLTVRSVLQAVLREWRDVFEKEIKKDKN